MKKQFMIGIILIFFLLLITPSLPAMEFTMVQETYENLVQKELKELSLDKIETLQNTKRQTNAKFSNQILHSLSEKNGNNFLSLISEKSNEANDPLFLLFLLIVYLIIYLVFKGIPNFIKNIITFIAIMSNGISIFIKNLLILIYNIIIFSVYGFGQLIARIWQGFGAFIGLMLDILRLIYDVIFPTVVQT